MNDLSQAEQYLLAQVRQGDPAAWAQLVERYQGRLIAFARTRCTHRADAEDLVQETFLQFLRGLGSFREEASLETYLFMILRRRIVDGLRGKRVNVCLPQGDEDEPASAAEPASPDLSASTYARRDEQVSRERLALSAALGELIDALKENHDFRDLKIVEMVFYGQMRNKDIARLSGLDENHIALIKHRWLKQLRDRVARRLRESDAPDAPEPGLSPDSLLTEVWEDGRLSCPKRSTLGRFLLTTLDPDWHDYADFHVNRLGCRFCRANLDDLQSQTTATPALLRDRVMQSTVGFFKKS